MRSRKSNSDRPLETLETRLRALPSLPTPAGLKARLLADIPAEAPIKILRWQPAARPRRLAIWASAALAVAVACLVVVRIWPAPGSKSSVPDLVADPEKSLSSHQDLFQLPSDSPGIHSWLMARRSMEVVEMPTFAWPIQEKSPLMILTPIPPDLLD
jgi:hypothetical protein